MPFPDGRIDYLRQAEELAHFAQSTEIELRGKNIGKDVVNNVRNVRETCAETIGSATVARNLGT